MSVDHKSFPVHQTGFLSFGRHLVTELRKVGKVCTADTYTTALNRFECFCGRRGDVLLEEISDLLMVEYEHTLKESGLCANTTSYYTIVCLFEGSKYICSIFTE